MSASYAFVGSMQWCVGTADRVRPYHHNALRLTRRFTTGPLDGEIALGIDRPSGAVEDFLPDRRRPTQGYATLRLDY